MQNFKSFLKESETVPTLIVHFETSHFLYFDEKEDLVNNLENEKFVHSIEFPNEYEIFVYFNNLPRDKYSKTGIEDIAEEFSDKLTNSLKLFHRPGNQEIELHNKEVHLEWKGLPTFLTKVEHVDIICQDNQVLTRIDKLIKCEYLSIYECDKIIGNVLSVMKIPTSTYIWFQSSFKSKLPDWAEIINDCLIGDRDILDCQEELISAGYKEYAKL